jgi:hydrogenase maturation protease
MTAGTILVFGVGNPGREDDGLGPALLARLEATPVPGIDLDCDYQLVVEDAAEVARHAVVVFVDASIDGPAPFAFTEIAEPRASARFTTHGASPAGVLGLAQELFQATTRGYLLGIRGVSFAMFTESLTPGAQAHLAAAEAFLRPLLAGGPAALAAAVGPRPA